jgi:hypothetical protein
MKKYALLLAVGLTLSGNANAITRQEFNDYLTDVQRDYPIVNSLRNEVGFKRSSTRYLRQNNKLSPTEILFLSYKENIQKYHNKMSTNPLYKDLVECSGSLHIALRELVIPYPFQDGTNTK